MYCGIDMYNVRCIHIPVYNIEMNSAMPSSIAIWRVVNSGQFNLNGKRYIQIFNANMLPKVLSCLTDVQL